MKSSFAEYVVSDLLGDIEGVHARAMFGGHGIYKDGLMFALVAEDELYYKVGDLNRKDFQSADSEPFKYLTKDKKAVVMSYWKLPSEIMDDREELLVWTGKAVRAAKAAAKSARARRCKDTVPRTKGRFRTGYR